MNDEQYYREALRFHASATQALTEAPIPFDDAPVKHMVYVQTIAGGGFFAACMVCGADQFINRRTLSEAEEDARAHGSLRHIYPRGVLERHDLRWGQQG